MAKSTVARRKRKVPLSVHKGSGLWCKVLGGKRYYFERVADDPQGIKSLDQWLEIKAGRTPKPSGAKSVEDVCNDWMAHKRAALDCGQIVQDTWNEYHHTCVLVMESIDKDADAASLLPRDFARLRASMAKRYGPVALGKHIGQVRSLFKFAYEEELIDRPAKFGAGFKKPPAKVMRKTRLERGDQDFTAAEVRRLLKTRNHNWRAMILLGVQGGFGNRDVAELTIDAVDLKAGCIDYARAKTATQRRVPLWRETVDAIRQVIDKHPGGTDRLFVGRRGRDFTDANQFGNNRISGAFRPVLKSAGFPDAGRGFYCLRRTFQTQAEECGDIIAVRHIMGHIEPENDMSARYRQRVSDARLRRAVNAVHGWLWPRPVVGEVAL